MLASSWRHNGQELLAFPASLRAYADMGAETAAPLLFPWANRLADLSYTVHGREVNLAVHRELVQFDAALPIHGALPHLTAMTVSERRDDQATAVLEPAETDPLLRVFPFPHRLTVRVAVGDASLTVETSLSATGDVPVPVCFGYHPYLALPSGDRDSWSLSTSARQHLLTDERQIPTGAMEPADLAGALLRDRTFDDGYTDLGSPGLLTVEGGDSQIAVQLDEGYLYAQIFAPLGKRFVALEPMTAPANALISGDGLRCVQPGGTFVARFTMTIS